MEKVQKVMVNIWSNHFFPVKLRLFALVFQQNTKQVVCPRAACFVLQEHCCKLHNESQTNQKHTKATKIIFAFSFSL